ncbi:unnamed protein product [Rhodiola kirilowii]
MENDPEEVNAIGGYQGYNNSDRAGPSRQFGQAPRQNWPNDSRTQQATPQPAQQFYQPPHRQYNQDGPGQYQPKGPNQYQAGPIQQGPSKPLEEIVKDLSNTVHQYMAKTDGAIADLGKQMSQLATEVSEYKNKPGRLPLQILQDPKENVNAVTLRSEQRRVIEPVEPEEEEDPEMSEEDQEGSETPGA